jgi:hypothetical protein
MGRIDDDPTPRSDVHAVVPPDGCNCASFWTIRGKHKADCPLSPTPAPETADTIGTLTRDACSVGFYGPKSEYRKRLQAYVTSENQRYAGEVLGKLLAQEEAGMLNERYGHWIKCAAVQEASHE